MANKNFNVLDMANEYAADNDLDTAALFNKPTPAEEDNGNTESAEESIAEKKNGWRPDNSLIADMPELQSSGAVYNEDEIKNSSDKGPLVNIADDNAKQSEIEQMNEMQRQTANIDEFKRRHNIQLHIPPGHWTVKFINASSEPNYEFAQRYLDELFEQLKVEMPGAIEYLTPNVQPVENQDDNPTNVKVDTNDKIDTVANAEKIDATVISDQDDDIIDNTQVVIDKRNVEQIVWTADEINKIRKSRHIELNIVESADINFSSIIDADDNAVDTILQQYTRKTNDLSSPLPASRYRATFTGLTYPEVIGLQSSLDLNTLDAERKKWSIAFNHMTNISIGPWEEYTWYKDENNNIVKVPYGAPVPANVIRHDVTKFEDFMRKTSYIDLNFILWKILCATTTDKEIVSITCGVINQNTHERCGNTYEWIYNPSSLLDPSDINEAVLDDMSKVADAGTVEAALKFYNEGPVKGNNVVKLKDSGWSIIYGHASAWDYVEGGIFDALRVIAAKEDDQINPDDIPNILLYTILTSIKAILVPDSNGGFVRISGANNLIKAFKMMGTVDFQTLGTISNMMTEPYNYKFYIKDAICPKCMGRSTIPVDNMVAMLFMINRSLESTTVTLTKQS